MAALVDDGPSMLPFRHVLGTPVTRYLERQNAATCNSVLSGTAARLARLADAIRCLATAVTMAASSGTRQPELLWCTTCRNSLETRRSHCGTQAASRHLHTCAHTCRTIYALTPTHATTSMPRTPRQACHARHDTAGRTLCARRTTPKCTTPVRAASSPLLLPHLVCERPPSVGF